MPLELKNVSLRVGSEVYIHETNLVIEEGCSFVIKPSVIFDGIGDFARWGETVAVTETGAKRLGTRPQEMRILV